MPVEQRTRTRSRSRMRTSINNEKSQPIKRQKNNNIQRLSISNNDPVMYFSEKMKLNINEYEDSPSEESLKQMRKLLEEETERLISHSKINAVFEAVHLNRDAFPNIEEQLYSLYRRCEVIHNKYHSAKTRQGEATETAVSTLKISSEERHENPIIIFFEFFFRENESYSRKMRNMSLGKENSFHSKHQNFNNANNNNNNNTHQDNDTDENVKVDIEDGTTVLLNLYRKPKSDQKTNRKLRCPKTREKVVDDCRELVFFHGSIFDDFDEESEIDERAVRKLLRLMNISFQNDFNLAVDEEISEPAAVLETKIMLQFLVQMLIPNELEMKVLPLMSFLDGFQYSM